MTEAAQAPILAKARTLILTGVVLETGSNQ